MIANLVTFFFLLALSLWIAKALSERHGSHYFSVFRNLIFYHIALSIVYYLYALFNPSDSWSYFRKVMVDYRGQSWGDFYGVSTSFIEFLGYPFIKYLQLPYESLMMVFAWFGLLGFFFFYIFLKEHVRFKHTFFGYDLLLIIIFLPNPHFWAASFGKGSIIFLGLALYFYGISRINTRFIPVIIGAIIVYHVRPHILFIVLIATAVGFTFSTKGINWATRLGVVIMSVIAFNYIYTDVIALIGFDEDEIINESTLLTRRIRGLTNAESGVDITQYSFPMKLFTFVFRPLFIDASGILGFIVSFENLFYLLLFLKVFKSAFISFLWRSDYIVKTAFVSFVGVSSALAQISANLGLAMRQKSQVIILMLFVILKFMDEQKIIKLRDILLRKKMQARPKTQVSSLKA